MVSSSPSQWGYIHRGGQGSTACSCKIFVMTIQSDYESTSLFSPFQYPLLSLTKEDKGAMKVSCAWRIYEKADF